MTILDTIAQDTKDRIAHKKAQLSLEHIRAQALALDICYGRFEQALSHKGMSFICEVKKASPSQGIIAKDFEPVQIAMTYQESGADCISCLTEPKHFLGDDKYLQDIAKCVNIPILRKDFILDSYMIYEAKVLGASAILLIVAMLQPQQIQEYLEIAHTLGLCVLTEVHDEKQLRIALDSKARIIGINNRDLRDFSVDIHTSTKLAKLVPNDVILVSESGIKTADDICLLESCGFDAVLIGQTLMSTQDKGATLTKLRTKDTHQ
ncbi:indole-3-glycerol phosphate synthase TrpC [uncultured Helicobacter sp.]|uniref:indole-3-glycerol phosphate synthase TrpC n=1 Tax=uncultured Helicobacter sp. TaxID=175537 RepID=UPI00374FD5D3